MTPKSNNCSIAKQPNNAINSPASVPLLRLPPELRNTIYEYALRLDDGACIVSDTAGIPESALLITCKRIRREAIGIFYTINELHMIVDSCSPSVPILVKQKAVAMFKQYHCHINFPTLFLRGPQRWRNLVSWLRATHADPREIRSICAIASDLDKKPHSPLSRNRAKEMAIVAGLFKMVVSMQGVQWEEVEEALKLLRYGLVRYDSEWNVG